MDTNQNTRQKRERIVWIAVATVLMAVLLAVLLPTDAFAQSTAQTRRSDSERALEMFSQIFRFVQENYVDEVEAEKLIQGALDGMFRSLGDPHSKHLSADEMRGLTDTTAGQFGGVGMYISKQPETEAGAPSFVEVVSPIEGTPAYFAGVQAGDLIVGIEGESTGPLSIDEVLTRLRGRPGSEVNLTMRRGRTHEFELALVRDIIQVPTVRHDMISGGIGFMRIIQFTPHTADRVRDAVDYFQRNGYRSMIIDLRRNPGGLLSGVVDTAGVFFDGGLVVGTRGRNPRENEQFNAAPGSIVPDSIPIVVLIDGGSASAAEILAGALKDRGRATLIGETTFGKGSVQQVRRIGDGGFRLTMSRYYTPDGTYIDQAGISPHKVVREPELSEEELESLTRLRNERRIARFVEANPSPSTAQIDAFVAEFRRDGGELRESWVRRLIRDEVNRVAGVMLVYDLEFDIVLQEAVRMLRNSEVARP
ncbi:MAG: S41 family peptidase [Spirochaetaceae bacterium]|nr:MAG: S41 family peptidase [Spirochaetaceae bacterium]